MGKTPQTRGPYLTPQSVRDIGNLALLLSPNTTHASRRRPQRPSRPRNPPKVVPDVARALKDVFTATMTQTEEEKKKKRSSNSSAYSKSQGKFKKARNSTSLADKFAVNGVVRKLEQGLNYRENRQVMYIAHSTMPRFTAALAMWQSLVKKIFMMIKIQFKNENVTVGSITDSAYALILSFKQEDGEILVNHGINVLGSDTLESIAVKLHDYIAGLSRDSLPNQLLRLEIKRVEAAGTWALATIDLTTTRFQFYSRSHLKIQNRSINSTGNDEEDDVDNVPINGKYFDYNTNSTVYRDYTTELTTYRPPTITTDQVYGLLPFIGVDFTATGTKMFEELPDRKQFVGCKAMGKSFLDPGHIKTSTMTDRLTIGLNKFMSTVYWKSPVADEFDQIWLGKSRLFAWEKMIRTVAETTVNSLNVGAEHKLEIGCICLTKSNYHTAPAIKTGTPINITPPG